MSTRRMLVVGGGIGGLTAALAARAAGCEVKVFERARDIEHVQVGSGITIYGNAMRAYRHLGPMDDLVRAGAEVEWQDFFDHAGHHLGRWESGELARETGALNISAPRGDFHRILVEALGREAIETGKVCAGYEQDGGGVAVRFEDGSSGDGDLLVGADGFESAVRRQLLGDEGQRYRYTGLTSWNAVVDFDHPPAYKVQASFFGPGARFLYVHLGGGKVGWVATALAREGEKDPPGGSREVLLERFGSWAPPVPDMVAMASPETIRRIDVVDRAPVKEWGSERVTLLGDAAHPMTFFLGQGACSAIEDGYVLGRRIGRLGATPDALRAYEQARVENAAWTVNASWRLGMIIRIKSSPGTAVRSAVMKRIHKRMFERLIGRVHSQARAEDAAPSAT